MLGRQINRCFKPECSDSGQEQPLIRGRAIKIVKVESLPYSTQVEYRSSIAVVRRLTSDEGRNRLCRPRTGIRARLGF
jgi:hypothetical protein